MTALRQLALAGSALSFLLSSAPVLAQEDEEPSETIIVLGGRAPGADITDRPVTQLDRSDLVRSGLDDLGDGLAFLPGVLGSEFNEDPGTQNDTSGTSSVNLRGLGLGSTLVLLNGQRQTVASVSADDGASFTDLNALVPDIAIERVDVLKDGASPVYGSDAVAGVVNVITRDTFEGVEAFGEWRGPTEYDGSGTGHEWGLIVGGEIGDFHLVGAVEWMNRDGLEGFETSFVPGTGISLGGPGSYLLPSEGFASYADPDCLAAGGILARSGPDNAIGTPGSCLIDYGQFFSFLTDEERLQAYGAVSGSLGETDFVVRVSGTDQLVERGNSPSLPNLNFPELPASLAGNPFGEDVIWLGRPRGAAAGPARRQFDHDTWRVDTEISRDFTFADRSWTAQLNAAYSRNELEATITDTLEDNFNLALAGFGGESCTGNTPGDTTAGCYFFNPFGSGVLETDPASPLYNDPAVIDFIIGEDVRTSRADLTVIEAVVRTDELFDLPAGPVSAAFGIHSRRETLRVDRGEDFNADNFLFIIGGPDYSGALDAQAIFADAIIPVTDRFDVQVALRHEDIDGFSSTDPKLAGVYEINDTLTLRGSWSQSFRSPSLHQRVSATTTLQSLNTGSASAFLPVRTVGNPDLDPETADTFTAGIVWQTERWTASADVWRSEYEDLIIRENANAVLAADLADDGIFNDPRVELSSLGDVLLVRTNFVNAPSVEAQGLDVQVEMAPIETGLGTFGWGAQGAYIDEFTLVDPVLNAEIDGAGQRNFTNFARSVPEFRGQAWLDWYAGPWDGRLTSRYISSYDDDENPGSSVDSWLSFDLQLGYTHTVLGHESRLSAGVLNIANEQPPFVDTPLGYDTKIHDPRGRVGYVRFAIAR